MNKKILVAIGLLAFLQNDMQARTVYNVYNLFTDQARRVVHPYIKPTTEEKISYGVIGSGLGILAGVLTFDSSKSARLTALIFSIVGLGAYKFLDAVHIQPSQRFIANVEKCDIAFLNAVYQIAVDGAIYSYADLVNTDAFYNFSRRDGKYPALSFEMYMIEQRKTLRAMEKFITTYNHMYDYNSRDILLEIARFIDIVQPVISELLNNLVNSYEYKQDLLLKKENEMREREQALRERENYLREREMRLKREELEMRERELLERETEKASLVTIVVNNKDADSF